MESDFDYLKMAGLVTRAKRGDQSSMCELAELIEPQLHTYIFRLTLNHHLAQDLVQDTLLEVVESLDRLERADKFWPWLMCTALGKVQHHYRDKRKRKKMWTKLFDKERMGQRIQERNEGLSNLLREELSRAMFDAMSKMKLKYRNVLVLRCFEQMSYEEIAEFMDCREIQARVLFFRAKHALKNRLARRGYRHGMLLSALILFGVVTAPARSASAASSITAATLEVGWSARLLGFVGTKMGMVMAAGVTALSLNVALNCFLWFIAVLCALLVIACVSVFVR